MRQRLINLGVDVIGNAPDEFARVMAADLVKFGKIAKAPGAKLRRMAAADAGRRAG